MKTTESDVQNAINVILSDNQAYTKSLKWAVNYCRAAKYQSGDDLKTQCLYILNNIQYWRNPQAKEVRKTLKSFAIERR